MDLLREGASAREGEHAIAERVAQWVWDFVAPGYGPGGGLKMVDEELAKPADALRAVPGDPGLAPYHELATGTREHGHHASLALLLASGVVRRALQDPKHIPAILAGVHLARRQASAWVTAHATSATPEEAVADTDPLLPSSLLAGLPDLVFDGSAHLDRIAVHAADVEASSWSLGIPITIEGTEGDVRVLVVEDVALQKPRTDASWRLSAAGDASDWADASIEALRAKVRSLGVTLLVSRKSIPEDLRSRLHLDGVATCTDAGKGLVARIGYATGARSVASLWTADPEDLGRGLLTRRIRRGDHLLSGKGPTATLEVPGMGPTSVLAEGRAEAWLRTVGAVWGDPRVLAGGGRWQRDLAQSLRQAAPHAPGKEALGMEVVAHALDDITAALLRNMGLDPSRAEPIDGIRDPVATVKPALRAGLDVAEKILRIDARFRKRDSTPLDLRGNLGPSGSPKGMPGDIPPLM